MGRRIGIDLGTTNSVVAVYDPQPKILDSREGRPQTRSVVGLRVRRGRNPGPAETLVGDTALDNFEMAPEDTIISIKRLMGRGIVDGHGDPDKEVQKVREWATYEVVEPADGTKDSVRVVMGGKQYSPVDISAMILRKLKEDAEFRLGEEVTHAVITVPAYFSQIQRDATRQAGLQAGLKVMQILDEPTAAAMAFGIDAQQDADPKTILVYDLGGGTFDVSVLNWAGNVFAQLDLEGDMWLGGDNFDQVLVEHTLRHVCEEYGIDVQAGRGVEKRTRLRFLAALRKAAQVTKERLGAAKSADLVVSGILKDDQGDPIDVVLEVTRTEFERMTRPLVERTVEITKKAVETAQLTVDQIDLVLMAGNATAMPMVQKAMEDLFGVEKVSRKIHPKHCVAMGAVIRAMRLPGIICQTPDKDGTDGQCGHINPLDATQCSKCGQPLADVGRRVKEEVGILVGIAPYHYGTQSVGDKFNIFVRKGDAYPTEKPQTNTFYTQVPNQRYVSIPVYGGMNTERASTNEMQGQALALLPPGLPKGTAVRIKLWLDGDGVFDLTAHLEDGTNLNPWILKGGRDAKAVAQLQAVDEALEKAKQAGEAAPDKVQEIEQRRDQAFDRLRNGDYTGALQLAGEAGDMLRAPDKDQLRQKAENLIGYAEFVIQQYSWALPPERTYRLTTVVEETKAAMQAGNTAALEAKAAELDRETDNLPDEVRMFLGMKGVIATKIRPVDPALATNLVEEVDEAENAFKTRSPNAPALLVRVAEKVHQAMQDVDKRPGPIGAKKCSKGHDTKGQRNCPVCGEDTWLVGDKGSVSSTGGLKSR